MSEIRTKTTAFAARHPRTVLMAVMLVCFIALQGSVAAEVSGDMFTTPSSGHSSGTGP